MTKAEEHPYLFPIHYGAPEAPTHLQPESVDSDREYSPGFALDWNIPFSHCFETGYRNINSSIVRTPPKSSKTFPEFAIGVKTKQGHNQT